MNTTEIQKFLEKEFTKTKNYTNKFPTEVKDYIIDYGKKYEYGLGNKIKEIFRLMKKGITEIPECERDGCKNKKMIRKCDGVMTIGCCPDHSKKASNKKKFGVEHNWAKGSKSRENCKATMLKKYGVEHNWQTGKLRENCKATMLKKYGVEHNWQTGKLRDKLNLKFIEMFGETSNMKTKEFREKSKETILKRYGVENVQQVPEIFEKGQKTRFKPKEYVWKTGEISIVQGYEPIVLSELEEAGYKFQDVITDAESMPEIWYEFEGKKKRYFPDFYIPSENLIIEVKSEYTLQADFDQNQAKFEATKNIGFDFKLEVR